jgi:hypothetical protein
MPLRISTKFFLDRKHVIARVGKGRAKALTKAGAMVYRSCQSQFLRGRATSRGTNRTAGTWRGLPLVERRTRRSNGSRITSWRSARNPDGFMRKSMAFAFDPSSQTVVVGPQRKGWLNELHEKGGTARQTLYLRFGGRPVPMQRAYGLRRTGSRFNMAYVGTYLYPRPSARSFVATSRSRTVRVRADRFQRKGLDKVRARIPEKFKDQISGP